MRIVAGVGAVALAVTSLWLAPANAASPKPSGTVECGLTGTMTFKPGIPSAAVDAADFKIRAKLKAVATNCTNTDLVNAKYPITAAKVEMKATITEGATCADFPSPPDFTSEENGKINVRWQGLNPSGRLKTVASNNVPLSDYTDIPRLGAVQRHDRGEQGVRGRVRHALARIRQPR